MKQDKLHTRIYNKKLFPTITIVIISLLLLTGGYLLGKNYFIQKQRDLFLKHVLITPSFTPTPIAKPTTIQYLQLSPTTMNTSLWNTYTDTILQYTIKYPSTVVVSAAVPGVSTTFTFSDDVHSLSGDLMILERGAVGHDAYYGYQITEGDCVLKENNCYSLTHIPDTLHWININNAYGIVAPFDPKAYDYYLTDEKKKGQVIRLVSFLPFLQSPTAEEKNRQFIIETMIRTLRFNR